MIAGYDVAAAGAYVALVARVVAGLLPVPALLMLLTIPLALRSRAASSPTTTTRTALMAVMGINVKLHLAAGLALLAGYADRPRSPAPSHRRVSLFLG